MSCKKSSYDKKRLVENLLIPYLTELYPSGTTFANVEEKTVTGYKSLLQNDYGKSGDCTLTCLTMVICGISKNVLSPQEVYDQVEKCAKTVGYNGDKWGTISLTIKHIFDTVLKHFNLKVYTVNKYFKGIGFTPNTIVSSIKKGNPVILSMQSDGRDYYGAHSVTVMGYIKYKVTTGKKVSYIYILKIYDNWYTTISYLPYDTISFVTSLNYVK